MRLTLHGLMRHGLARRVAGLLLLVGGCLLPSAATGTVGVAETVGAVPDPPSPHARAASDTTTFAYAEVPLKRVLADVEARTGVRFLYRDALVAGVNVSLRTTGTGRANVLDALSDALRPHGLRLQVDAQRRQALLTRGAPTPPSTTPRSTTLRGQVLDDATGARLPLATLTWHHDGRLRGTATDDAGAFRVRLTGALARRDTLTLTASYVGYAARQVRVDPSAPPAELSIRLPPKETEAPEVVVRSSAMQSTLDTTWQSLIRPDRAGALSESSVLRALSPLPSVGLTATLGEGLNVRGSQADAFQVLLDGVPIYNQSHLFGLFDAFNADALQTVGFYYGVAPAEYAAPPGGTLAFRTRTGAQTEVRGTAGVSSTSLHATVEGPLGDGRGSWLVAGRHSYLDAIPWLRNESLVAQGLGVDPDVETLPVDRQFNDVSSIRPTEPSARFYDVHGKLYWETDGGARLSLSGYAGGDDTGQQAQRLFLVDTGRRFPRVQTEPVDASNDWGNEAAALQAQWPMGEALFAQTRLSFSRYHAAFGRSSFLTAGSTVDRDPAEYAFDFSLDNELRTLGWEQRLTWMPGGAWSGTWTGGYALQVHDLTYADAFVAQQTAATPRFRQERRATQVDAFAQVDWSDVGWVDAQAGLRTQFFDLSGGVRASPRLHVRLFPDRRWSVGAGYSRNHQFLNRVSFANDNVDVWVLSTDRQPPHVSDHVTGGVYWTSDAPAAQRTSVQVEAYLKHQRNVRLYESIAQTTVDLDGIPARPFTAGNDVRARGVELLAQQRFGRVTGTVSYTLARADLDPEDASGERPAPWDRRYQFAARLDARVTDRVSVFGSGYFASGVPNTYAPLPREPERLGDYHRVDLGMEATYPVGATHIDARIALYNVYDRNNPWYRTPVLTVTTDDATGRVVDRNWQGATVYDLGIQPSFAVSVRW